MSKVGSDKNPGISNSRLNLFVQVDFLLQFSELFVLTVFMFAGSSCLVEPDVDHLRLAVREV